MSYDPYGTTNAAPYGMPVVDVTSLGIDPMTGQPYAPAPAGGVGAMLSPTNLAVLGGGAYLGRRKLASAAKKLNLSGLTRGKAAKSAVDGLATQGAAARAGLNIQTAPNLASSVRAVPNIPVAEGVPIGRGAAGAFSRVPPSVTQGAMSSLDDIAAHALPQEAAAGGRFAALRGLAPGMASPLRMGGATIAAPIAGGLVDKLNVGGKNSTWDQAATGAAFGGTAGAFLGGPAGAAVGAGLGAVGNLTYNAVADKFDLFGHGDKKAKPDMNKRQLENDRFALQNTALDLGLSDADRASLMANYNIALRAAGDDPALQAQYSRAATQQLLTQLPQTVQANKTAQQQQNVERQWIGSLQQWASPYMEQARLASEVQAQQFEQMAQMAKSPEQSQLYMLQAANARKSAAGNAATWMQQLALAPGNAALAQQQQQQQAMMQSYVSQLQQKAISDAINPQSSTGDFASLVQ